MPEHQQGQRAIDLICPSCFKRRRNGHLCDSCGYDEVAQQNPHALPARIVLNGTYIVGRVLGRLGGFGITYLAWDVKKRELVAIKEYYPRDLAVRARSGVSVAPATQHERGNFEYGLKRFIDEARTLTRFNHPNVVRVRSFFQQNGTAYIVMDYYAGETLEEYALRKGGRLRTDAAIAILLHVLDGLRAVHAEGFLHRDIKPQNIYLTKEGRIILLDFGAARTEVHDRARSASIVFTPGYAPLEQISHGAATGPWSDVYACAGVLWYMIAGTPPPGAAERVLNDTLEASMENLGMAVDLKNVFREALALDPSRRTQSVVGLSAAVRGVKGAARSETRRKEAPPPPPSNASDASVVSPSRAQRTERLVLKLIVLTFILAVLVVLLFILGLEGQNGMGAGMKIPDAMRLADGKERAALLFTWIQGSTYDVEGVYARWEKAIADRRHDEAAQLVDTLQVRVGSASFVSYAVGATLLARGYFVRAIHYLREAIEADKNVSRYHVALGNAYYFISRYDSAVVEYRHARQYDATLVPHERLVQALVNTGDMLDAASEVVSLRSRYPDRPENDIAEAIVRIGQNDVTTALSLLKTVNERSESALASRLIAYILKKQGAYELSMEMIDKAIRSDPADYLNFVIIADILAENGNELGAIAQYNKALELAPEDTDILLRLGTLHFEIGNAEAGCASFRCAADLGSMEAGELLMEYNCQQP